GLDREELLKRPVYIEHRPKKDPRDLRILDPACGSGHFLLYAFDLLERIFEEAWSDSESPKSEVTGRTIQEDFETLDHLRREIPKLIVEHNLHGIDIDPRAVQIAASALWLRAQKTWKSLGLKAQERPRIARSNIVTAEPMPGEEDMRREFTAGLKPRVLGQIVDEVFEKMKLAGEAGSLLKIEEEIKEAVAAAGNQWREGPKPEQQLLFPVMASPRPKQQELRFDVKGVTDERFWDQAEDRILEALKEYAERAENGHATRRRLFAEDAARGFAFIDLCRKRYSAVVMNPPFGQSSASSAKYIKSAFGKAAFDLFASFLEGGLKRLESTGSMGAITTSAGFYRNQVAEWRADFFLDGSIRACADLGGHVLDGATVRAATYVRDASPRVGNSVFVRCNESSVKDETLFSSIESLCTQQPLSNVFILDARLLKEIPGAPLAYWLPERFRREVANLQRFADAGGDAQFGLSTKDDFRFLRLAWEAPASEIGREVKWCYTSKGGSYSPFYFDIHLLTLHQNDFHILEQAILKKYPYLGDSAGWVLHRENNYYSPGLTFQRRTNKPFAPRALPANCLFTDNGPTLFWQRHSLPAFLGLFNSSVVKLLAAVGNGALEAEGGGGANSYEVGIINNIVVPELPDGVTRDLEKATLQIVKLKQAMGSGQPETRVFLMPRICGNPYNAIATQTGDISKIHERIDKLVSPYYGFAPGEVEDLLATVSPRSEEGENEVIAADEESETVDDVAIELGDDRHNLVSYFLGASFGRWDIRYATGERQPPELPDPFAPLPVCPPGMLQNAEHLPAEPTDVPANYPLRVSWDGILVDDPGFNGDRPHRDDIVRRVREVFDLLWKDKSHEIEQETCDILGVSDLRDYFRKPAGFFQDHLKRYSKSRRKAPIYWPLSTPSGSYTIWLYYHRLNEQTLYGAVNKYVEPKISEVERGTAQIENDLKAASGRQATRLTDRLGEARAFLAELRDMREELLRIAALPYKPDLNDGVIINAAPFHGLFRLRSWAKDTEDCWKKLAKGDYDWAHSAYTIWPDRVR
ncbi:MAG: BREX-1 system adenine-specific DNA-methyltransferase PglX, partial [Rhodopirellula sp.]|nr:BREX-1 system adenine-specific DNA-methyltransferase PglX [Rhodopirellula sp.]